MFEQKREETPKTSEQIKQELKLYLQDADFGTAKFNAFFDMYELEELREERTRLLQRVQDDDP